MPAGYSDLIKFLLENYAIDDVIAEMDGETLRFT